VGVVKWYKKTEVNINELKRVQKVHAKQIDNLDKCRVEAQVFNSGQKERVTQALGTLEDIKDRQDKILDILLKDGGGGQ
jgi:hypothetical protein